MMLLQLLPMVLAANRTGGPRTLESAHVFSLQDLELAKLLVEESIAGSFDNLIPDSVSVDAQGATMQHQRQHRYAAFDVAIPSTARPKLTQVAFKDGAIDFAQVVDDFRNATRTFVPMESYVRDSQFLHQLIQLTASWASASMYGAYANNISATVSVHQVRQVAAPGHYSDNAPEG